MKIYIILYYIFILYYIYKYINGKGKMDDVARGMTMVVKCGAKQ